MLWALSRAHLTKLSNESIQLQIFAKNFKEILKSSVQWLNVWTGWTVVRKMIGVSSLQLRKSTTKNDQEINDQAKEQGTKKVLSDF